MGPSESSPTHLNWTFCNSCLLGLDFTSLPYPFSLLCQQSHPAKMRIPSWLPHLLAQRTVPCFQQEILFPRRNILPPVKRNSVTFIHNKMSVFENVIFVRSSATCFTHIWQTLNDLSSPMLRPALRRLFYLQLPSSRASCPFPDALEHHQRSSILQCDLLFMISLSSQGRVLHLFS